MKPITESIPVDAITVGERYRKDMGDLPGLAGSMKKIQKHAIGVMPSDAKSTKFKLVWGQRRLLAAKQLGWSTIEAKIVDIGNLLEMEFEENEFSKAFTVSERVAIAKAMKVEIGERRVASAANAALEGQRTDDVIAEKVGFGSADTLARATEVVEHGSAELVKAMDDKAVSIADAAKVTGLSFAEQNGALRAKATGTARTVAAGVKRKPRTKKTDEVPVETVDLNDEVDYPVPPGLASVFTLAKGFQTIINDLNRVKREAKALKDGPAGVHLRLQQFEIDVDNAKRTIRFDAPHAVCPVCLGDAKKRKAKCPCQDVGWLNESNYRALPIEYRK